MKDRRDDPWFMLALGAAAFLFLVGIGGCTYLAKKGDAAYESALHSK